MLLKKAFSMGTRIKALLILISLLCPSSSGLMASTFKRPLAGSNTVIIRKDQNGKEIRVRRGDLIQVELPALGSAGYTWHIDNLKAKYIEVISEETKTDVPRSKTGAPVVEIWRFRVKNEGDVEIKLDYYRTWERKDKSADHFLIRLHITSDHNR
jgi:predicted secreted protein